MRINNKCFKIKFMQNEELYLPMNVVLHYNIEYSFISSLQQIWPYRGNYY